MTREKRKSKTQLASYAFHATDRLETSKKHYYLPLALNRYPALRGHGIWPPKAGALRSALGLVCCDIWGPRFLIFLMALSSFAGRAQDELSPLLQRHWFEARTAHFNVYSCGETQQFSKLIGRLEQFRQAYSLLAGAQAVASPPIVVLAFPDAASMRPFLPQRQGKPASLTAFFTAAVTRT